MPRAVFPGGVLTCSLCTHRFLSLEINPHPTVDFGFISNALNAGVNLGPTRACSAFVRRLWGRLLAGSGPANVVCQQMVRSCSRRETLAEGLRCRLGLSQSCFHNPPSPHAPLRSLRKGFKARLDGALSTLGWWKVSLLMAGGLEPDGLQGPSQPKPFHDSVNVNISPEG